MANELLGLYTNLEDSFDVHLNNLYTDFDIIIIAEFLDTCTYNLVNCQLSILLKKIIIPLLANMCTKDEIMSPYNNYAIRVYASESIEDEVRSSVEKYSKR